MVELGAAKVDGSKDSRVLQGPEAIAVDLAAARERDRHHAVLRIDALKEVGEAVVSEAGCSAWRDRQLGPQRAVTRDLAQVLRAGAEADEARHWEQLAAVEEQVIREVGKRWYGCLLFFIEPTAPRPGQHWVDGCLPTRGLPRVKRFVKLKNRTG